MRARERDIRPAGDALDLLAPKGTMIVSSYSDAKVSALAGQLVHAGRLGLRADQVGTVSPARSARRTTAGRLALALELLRDTVFDIIITGASRFDELPSVMASAAGGLPALCHTVAYDEASPCSA